MNAGHNFQCQTAEFAAYSAATVHLRKQYFIEVMKLQGQVGIVYKCLRMFKYTKIKLI